MDRPRTFPSASDVLRQNGRMGASGWVMGGPGDPEEHREPARCEKPTNEIPVAVPLVLVLAHTDDVAVFVSAAHIFGAGLSFQLTTLTRMPSDALRDRWRTRDKTRGGLLFGVELSDGRRASTDGSGRHPGRGTDAITLTPHGGGGDDTRIEQDYYLFLSPVPGEGSMTFYLVWLDLGLEQSSVTTSTTGWAEEAGRVAELWPPQMPTQLEPFEPPQPPPGTWFDQP